MNDLAGGVASLPSFNIEVKEMTAQQMVSHPDAILLYEESDNTSPQMLLEGSVGDLGTYEEDDIAVGTIPATQQVLPDGSFTYSIPIVTSGAVNGLKPEVALTYSSLAGEGVMGKGWSIAGASAIQRCGDVGHPVRFNEDDLFCLNGQKLMLVDGTHGLLDAEYRTELNSNTRITISDYSDGEPSEFKVEHLDGKTSYYGKSTATITAANAQKTYAWAINKIEDIYENQITYEYEQTDGSLEFVLTRINYTQNAGSGSKSYIKFSYVNKLEFNTVKYAFGELNSITRRLKEVTSYSDGYSLRNYAIDYVDNFVDSIEVNKGTTYLAKTRFQWHKDADENSEFGEQVHSNILGKYNYKGSRLADVNGDGFVDLISIKNSQHTHKDYLRLNKGTADGFIKEDYDLSEFATDTFQMTWTLGDINGDGYTDLVYLKEGSWHYHLSDGQNYASTTSSDTHISGDRDSDSVRLIDFDLDGTLDIVVINSASIRLHKGVRSFTGGRWTVNYPAQGELLVFDYKVDNNPLASSILVKKIALGSKSDFEDNLKIVDLNGDGQVEIIARVHIEEVSENDDRDIFRPVCDPTCNPGNTLNSVTHNDYLFVFDSASGKFEKTNIFSTDFIFVDINGDGLVDRASSTKPNETDGVWSFNINQSSSSEFVWSDQVVVGDVGASKDDIRFVDNNLDGFTDFVFFWPPENSVYKDCRTNDTGQSTADCLLENAEPWRVKHVRYNVIADKFEVDATQNMGVKALSAENSGFGDMNGDGFLDYYTFDDGDIEVHYREDTPTNLIVKVTDGYGAETDIVYGSLNNPDVHTRSNSVTLDTRYWGDSAKVTDIIYPMHVVKFYQEAQQSLEYQYEGGKIQAGRGPIGFEKVIVTNHTNSSIAEASYRQDFPFIGAIETSASKVFVQNASVECEGFGVREDLFYAPDQDADTQPICTVDHSTVVTTLSSSNNNYVYIEDEGSYTAVLLDSETKNWDYNTGSLLKSTNYKIRQPVAMFIQNNQVLDRKASLDEFGRPLVTETRVSDKISDNAISETTQKSMTYANQINGEAGGDFWGKRLVRSSVVKQRSGHPAITRTSEFHYDELGALSKTIKEPDSAEFAVITSVDSRDSFGNVDQQSTSIINLDVTSVVDPYDTSSLISKTVYSTFDSSGRYVVSTTNEEGHVTTNSMNSFAKAFGYSDRVTDANGNYVEYDYSRLGRKFKEEDNLGGGSQITLQWCAGVHTDVVIDNDSCPAGVNAVYVKITETIGAPDSFEYYDEQGRVILTKAANSDGDVVNQVIVYDIKGRKERESVPFKDGATQFFTSYGYDLLNRVRTVTKPDGSVWVTNYENYETTQTSPITGRENKEVKDAHGRIISVTDTLPNSTEDYSEVTTEYDYDSVGNLVAVDGPMAEVDGHDDIIVTEFDSKGYFKTSMTDPDKGYWTYKHNAYGQLVEQTNANGQFVKTSYDKLGRTKTVIRYKQDESSQIASNITYEYDTAERGTSGKDAIGLASVMDSVSNTGKSYQYDNLGRVDTTLHVIEGAVYTESTQYDSIGRAYRHTDVSGKTVQTYFNDQGFQYAIKDIDSGVVYWEAKASDQFGNVTEYTLHNNTISGTNGFDQQTGLAKSNRAGVNNSLVNIEYDWDTFGNLEYRENLIQNKTESFTYDDLNRLKSSTINGIDLINSYYKNGNIKTKGGTAGQYCYDMVRPHAVIGISTDNCNDVDSPSFERFVYDDNGNMTSGLDRSLEYSVSDMVTKITKGNSEVYFSYGPENNRYKRVDVENGETTTTLYVGNVEIVTKNGVETFKRTIGGVVQVNELFNDSGLSIQDYTYMFKDHLGSIVATTNHMGARVQQLSYDAWGQRRPADWSLPTQDDYLYRQLLASSNSLVLPLEFNRGYTGHEHIDSMGIIHMNGRIYDPVLGRFLQADPFIQFPYNTQNLNRYSYLMNNPLNATDPSGYFLESALKSWVIRFAMYAINPALGAAYDAYNTMQMAASIHQAITVWHGGGDVAWGDMAASFVASQVVSSVLGDAGEVGTKFGDKVRASFAKPDTDLKVAPTEVTDSGVEVYTMPEPDPTPVVGVCGDIRQEKYIDFSDLSGEAADPFSGRFSPATGFFVSENGGGLIFLRSSEITGVTLMTDSQGNSWSIDEATLVAKFAFHSGNGSLTPICPSCFLVGGKIADGISKTVSRAWKNLSPSNKAKTLGYINKAMKKFVKEMDNLEIAEDILSGGLKMPKYPYQPLPRPNQFIELVVK